MKTTNQIAISIKNLIILAKQYCLSIPAIFVVLFTTAFAGTISYEYLQQNNSVLDLNGANEILSVIPGIDFSHDSESDKYPTTLTANTIKHVQKQDIPIEIEVVSNDAHDTKSELTKEGKILNGPAGVSSVRENYTEQNPNSNVNVFALATSNTQSSNFGNSNSVTTSNDSNQRQLNSPVSDSSNNTSNINTEPSASDLDVSETENLIVASNELDPHFKELLEERRQQSCNQVYEQLGNNPTESDFQNISQYNRARYDYKCF